MANLAIKGHPTRGSEVIALLEMLGGENIEGYIGSDVEELYGIEGGEITHVFDWNNYKYFTLEEFEENFPYKVGDMARLSRSNIAVIIKAIKWENDEIVYRLSCDDSSWWSVNNLKPYREKTMEGRPYKELRMPLDDDDKLATEVTIDGNKILPPNGYLIGKITQVDNGMLVEYVKQQPSYPKTYEECCRVVNANPYIILTYDLSNGQKYSYDADNIELHNNFRRLKICRDAYWKIAGEQMGLGKPWEPDWTKDIEKYVIYPYQYLYSIDVENYINTFLAFPTKEMRDAFYENFKELIEICKELL